MCRIYRTNIKKLQPNFAQILNNKGIDLEIPSQG